MSNCEHESRLPPDDTISGWVEENFPIQLERLRQAVQQNSHTLNVSGVDKLQDQYAAELSKMGLVVEEFPITERGKIIVAETRAALAEGHPTLVFGHADTVHTEQPSFKELLVEGQKASGPGVYDMKAGNEVILQALAALREHGALDHIPIKILMNSAEEDSVQESFDTIAELSRGSSVALVFEFGRRDSTGAEIVVTSRKGRYALELHVAGEGGHAAQILYSGNSASVAIAKRIVALDEVFNSRENDRSANVGVLRSGTGMNVIPAEALAEIELRGRERKDMEETLERARVAISALDSADRCSSRLITLKAVPPMEKHPQVNSHLARILNSANQLQMDLREGSLQPGVSDGNTLSATGLPVIDALGPLGGGAHERSEWVSLPSLKERTALLIRYLLDEGGLKARGKPLLGNL